MLDQGFGLRLLCPRARAVYQTILSLPCFPLMEDRDVRAVVGAVRKVAAAYAAPARLDLRGAGGVE